MSLDQRERRVLLILNRALTDVFQVELVEMGEPAVAAPDGEVVAPDGHVMGAGNPAVPAACGGHQLPDIEAPDRGIASFPGHILNPGNEYPGGTAVLADNLGLVGYRLDDLVGLFPAVVARGPVPGEDKPVRHV